VSLLGVFLSNVRGSRKASSRSSQRFPVLTPARIRPERLGGEWTDCMLDDLSGGGACIQVRLDLGQGDHAELRLNPGFGREIGVRARVVHAKTSAPGARPTYGVRFTDLAYPDCQALTAYLASRESAQLQGVRLRT